MEALVRVMNTLGSEEAVSASSLNLANAGYQLFNRIVPFYESETANKIRDWLNEREKDDQPLPASRS